MSVLVTGGTGYIGSHTCLALLEEGWDVVVIDNLSNSELEPLNRIEGLTGKPLIFYQVDVCDKADVLISILNAASASASFLALC